MTNLDLDKDSVYYYLRKIRDTSTVEEYKQFLRSIVYGRLNCGDKEACSEFYCDHCAGKPASLTAPAESRCAVHGYVICNEEMHSEETCGASVPVCHGICSGSAENYRHPNQYPMVTKEQFHAYEKVRTSGKTNMLSIGTVSRLSGLSRHVIVEIMNSYSELLKDYGSKE